MNEVKSRLEERSALILDFPYIGYVSRRLIDGLPLLLRLWAKSIQMVFVCLGDWIGLASVRISFEVPHNFFQ